MIDLCSVHPIAVVVDVSHNLGFRQRPEFAELHTVSVCLNPVVELSDGLLQALFLSFNLKDIATALFPSIEREAEKVETFVALLVHLAQTRLVLVYGDAIFRCAFFEGLHKIFGLIFLFEEENRVVRVSDDDVVVAGIVL